MADIVHLDNASERSILNAASCAFGVFDGLHRGHRFLIDRAIVDARADGAKAVVLTFDIDPDELFHADRLHKLMTNDERLDVLAESGVDAVAVLRFGRAFAALSPQEFLERTFAGNLPAHLHVGYDIRFGCKASGTLFDLQKWGSANGVEVVGHDLLEQDGAPITATRIRLLLESGDEQAAADLLGHSLRLSQQQ